MNAQTMTPATDRVTHSTFVIERNYPASPDRVFAAFADPARKRRWFAEGEGHKIEEFTMDFRVGGREFLRVRLPEGTSVAGLPCTGESIYQDIVPDRRIVTAGTMSIGDRRISASLATFEFVAQANGTQLILTHHGAFFEGADGPEMREAGWRKLLDHFGEELSRHPNA